MDTLVRSRTEQRVFTVIVHFPCKTPNIQSGLALRDLDLRRSAVRGPEFPFERGEILATGVKKILGITNVWAENSLSESELTSGFATIRGVERVGETPREREKLRLVIL